jgi:hypothetical protein
LDGLLVQAIAIRNKETEFAVRAIPYYC